MFARPRLLVRWPLSARPLSLHPARLACPKLPPLPAVPPSAPSVHPVASVPGALAAEPALRAHFLRMRQLRPGLHLHTDDACDERDLTAQAEIEEGLRIVLLLEGSVDVSYGPERVRLTGCAGHASALLVSVAERERFTRRARQGTYARRVSLGLGWDWIAQALGEGGDPPGARGQLGEFRRRHLAMQRWQASPRAVAIAEQLVRPPVLEPLLQHLYLESRTLELVGEALGTLYRNPAAPPPPAASPAALRPREHQRLRELHAFLGSGEADQLSLDEIARRAGVNANTLQRQFRTVYGTTVFDYLRDCRLQRARQALERDGLTVGQAAMVAGYTSAANFATAYKRRFGLSPKQARGRV